MKKFLSILLISLAIILVLNSCGDYTIIVQKNTTTSPTEKPTTPAHTHTECIDAAVDPTCTQTGLTEGSHCSDCGMIFTPQEEIPMLDHTFDDQYDDTCNECGYIRDAECAHTETEVIEGKDATCTEIGYTDGAKCVKCGEILLEQTEIPTLEHTYTSVVTLPTCTELGYTTYTCQCGESYIDDYTDTIAHSYTAVVTHPTCTERGYTTYTCKCGDNYVGDYTNTISHSYTAIVTPPTSTEMGYTTYICKCGDSYVSDYVTDVDSKYPLQIADNANTLGKYNLQLTVGNSNSIALGTLFSLVEGETIVGKTIVVNVYEGSTTATPTQLLSITADANWASQTIKLGNASSKAIIEVLVDGEKGIELPVTVVAGNNVIDEASWKAASASSNIIVLNDFSFADFEVADSTGGGIAKNIGSKAIYGNLHKITFGKYIIKVKANNYFIYMTTGSVNDLIIVGPTYSTLATTQSNGATTGTFVAGVQISGAGTISNSYIYGFRTPVRIDSGTPTISNSVIEGGNYASIYVYGADKVVLNNSKVVQNRAGYMADGKKVIGIGIFVDTNDTNGITYEFKGDTNGITFELKGDTKIYCWVNSSDSYDISNFETYRNYIFEKVDVSYRHGEYINLAILQEKSSSSSTTITVDSTNLNGISYTTATFKAGGFFGIGAKNYGFASVQSHVSSGCECEDQINNIPTLDDFISNRTVK